jgi:hypothetical protein
MGWEGMERLLYVFTSYMLRVDASNYFDLGLAMK